MVVSIFCRYIFQLSSNLVNSFFKSFPVLNFIRQVVFIDVNNFHHLKKLDTIGWFNLYNFQRQMIRECFYAIILIVESTLFLTWLCPN